MIPSVAAQPYTPADIQSAYVLPSANRGFGLTVAIVDAYDLPTAESDLAQYRSWFGLPACTTNNGCFRKVDQNGGSNYPVADAGWGLEIALDLEMVSAACPNCNILLVEASTATFGNMGQAVNTAVALGAFAVSNSYGALETSSDSFLDASYYNHPGVVITVSSGDCGYNCAGQLPSNAYAGVEYPAASPYVVAVGGTTLSRAANARGWTESAWGSIAEQGGAGSGCSWYEPKPAWQVDWGCSGRTETDVSAVADPNPGVWVFQGGWTYLGGTSAASPIIAATFALAGRVKAGTYPAGYLYAQAASLHDVVGGTNLVTNQSCTITYLCYGVAGYDGPTGLGTPNGVAAFAAPATLPGPPTNVTAVAYNASAGVSWSAPADNGGAAITRYTAVSSPGGRTCATSGTGCTVAGLTNGQPYTFTVTATNSVGTGPASTASAPVTPVTVPGSPTAVIATVGTLQAQVAWSAPASDGGSPIIGYAVTSSPAGHTCSWTSGPLNCLVTGLSNGQAYRFTVAATNGVGTGPGSAVSPPVTPTATVTACSPGDVTLSITIVTGDQVACSVTPGTGAAFTSWTVTGMMPTTSASATDTFTAGTAGTGTVTGDYTDDLGTHQVVFNFTILGAPEPPGRPTGVVATPGNASATVAWVSPINTGGRPITSYAVTSLPDGKTCAPVPATAFSCIVTGLTNGQPYTFTVTASNVAGPGQASAASSPVTPAAPPTSSITPLPAYTLSTFVTVSWGAIATTNPVASFDVRARWAAWNGAFGGYATWLSATATTSSAFAMSRGYTYCLSVLARDTIGITSAWSAETCTGLPLDDRSLARTSTWSAGTGSAYYAGTYVRSTTAGAKLTRTGVVARRVVLIATTCRTCGSVRVYWRGVFVRTVSLYSSHTTNKRIITILTFTSAQSGTLMLKVSTSGKPVIVDGVGIQRV